MFSNTKFGDKQNSFNFEFADLVKVDESKIAAAFKTTIDQNAVSAKTQEYMTNISNDITADTRPAREAFVDRFKTLSDEIFESIAGISGAGTYKPDEIEQTVTDFMKDKNFADLTEKYYIPAENFTALYTGFLEGLLKTYAEGYKALNPMATEIAMNKILYDKVLEGMLETVEVAGTFDALAINATEIVMKADILTAVGGLTSYLSSSFASAVSVDQSELLSAFSLNFSEDELARVVSAMFNKSEATLNTNLALMGYQPIDDPMQISFYFASFDGKTHFMEFI